MKLLSLFKNARQNTPEINIPVEAALRSIQDGTYEKQITHLRKIRKTKGEDVYREAKKNLPAVTFAAAFKKKRGTEEPFTPTGIIPGDIDHLNGSGDELRAKLEQDRHISFVFKSPSEDGLKFGCRFKGDIKDDETYKRCWERVREYIKEKYAADLDPTGKDISRLCFLSYDPNLYINQTPEPFEIPDPEPENSREIPIEGYPNINIPFHSTDAEEKAYRALEHAYREIVQSQPNYQHETRLRMARLVGGYVAGGLVSHSIARAKLEEAVKWSGAKDMKASMKTIDDGLAYGFTAPISEKDVKRETEEYLIKSMGVTKAYPKCNQSVTKCNKRNQGVTQKSSIKSGGVTSVTNVTSVTAQKTPQNEEKMSENGPEKSSAYNRNARARLDKESSHNIKTEELVTHTDVPIHNLISANRSFLIDCFTSKYNLSETATLNNILDAIRCDPDLTETEKANAEDFVQTVSKKCTSTETCYLSKGGMIEFVESTEGFFDNREVYDVFGAKSKEEKMKVRANLAKLVKDGLIERDKRINGRYRRILKECDIIEFFNASDDCVDIWLPLGLHQMVKILPGNIVLVAGSSNSGKTTLLLNTIRYNLNRWKIHYFNSEMGAGELKDRLKKFGDITLSDWRKAFEEKRFIPKERSRDFQDVIVPGEGNINIIDFLEIHENFWEIGGVLRDIHERLDGAIAVIAIQKNFGSDLGRGGMATIEKPRLAIAVEKGWAKIVKAKNFMGDNPNGKVCKFKIVQGTKLIMDKDWHKSAK